MARTKFAFAFGVILFCMVGCGRESAQTAGEVTSSAPAEAPIETKGPAPALAEVNESLKAGSYAAAAARLLELQASGRNFSQREAADYRKAMNEAYARALEAAEKGDARAEAAIKMIRAANVH